LTPPVAKLADVLEKVTQRVQKLLTDLEKKNSK
jgi:hypothetical protein